MPKILRVLLAVPLILLLVFVSIVSWFGILGGTSLREQTARMEQLRASDAAPVPSGDTHEFDDVTFDRLQVVATHNSYVLRPTWLQTVFIGLVEPEWAPRLQYDHAPLTDQLDAGIRSIELDVRWDGTGFSMEHLPLVANRGVAVDFAMALEEIALWSQRNPGHLPISIMLEVKEDYMFLDPTLEKFDAEAFEALDAVIREQLGALLLAPDDVRGDWPTVGEMRDRVLFYFWENEDVRERYLEGHPGLAGRAVFTSSQTGEAEARFAVVDDPNDPRIRSLVASGVIVRTRGDADLAVDAGIRDAALESGAQIVSTDFPPYWPHETGYTVEVPGGGLWRTLR